MNQEIYILYADVLGIVNFSMDFLCLLLTAKLTPIRFVGWRAVFASLMGAVYSVGAVFLEFLPTFVTVTVHCTVGALLCVIAFPYRSLKMWARAFFLFLLSEACLGGVISAFYYIGRGQVSALGILCIGALGSGMLFVYGLYCRKKVYTKTMKIEIRYGDKQVFADLLVDSGNLVTEPFSALPVVILSASVLPEPLNHPTVKNSPIPLRAIPVRTATGLGLLYGFIPDQITLCNPFEKPRRIDAVIGIDTDTKDFSGSDGLLPSALL